MKLSNFSVKRPIFTIVTMFLVIILGAVSFMKIPLKLIPDLDPPVGVVFTNYEGAGPEEVLEKVTKPLESSLATAPGLKSITSSSSEGSNMIFLEFSWTTSMKDVQSDIQQRIDQVPLPDDVGKPQFMKFDPSQFPVIQFVLKADEDVDSLKRLAEEMKLELSKTEGVASVNMSGTTSQEVNVVLDQDKLTENSLTQSDIVNVIRANNITMPGDYILTDDKELTTRIISLVDSTELIEELVVTVNPADGSEVKIADIAEVDLVNSDDRTITRANQTPAVLLSVLQQSDANTAQVSNEFTKELDKLLDKDEFANIEADVLFDQGDFIKLAIENITSSLVLGGIFAMLVLFTFLKSIKSPLIIGIAIPYSVIVTFVLIFFADFTINIMTLGGLALGVGMLVDNSIVVIENIYRHLSMNKDPKEAARTGAKEVGMAITASTMTTIAVFLPVVFIPGIIGQLFKEFAMTISFSLLASLFVALTVVPMLASRLLTKPKENIEEKRQQSSFLIGLESATKWSLRHRFSVIFIALALLAAGAFGLNKVGTEFLPAADESFFSLNVKMENGTALAETNKVIEAIEDVLDDKSDIETYVALVGATQEGSFSGSKNADRAEFYVKMKDLGSRDDSTLEFVDDIKKEVERAASKANKTAELSFVVQSSAGSNPNTVTFSVRDNDEERLEKAVDKIYDKLVDLSDTTELTTDLTNRVEEVQIEVDREKALEAGLTPSQIAMVVNDATRGNQAIQMVDESAKVHNVYVNYDEEVTQDIDGLKSLLIKKQDGDYIKLSDLAEIEIAEGPVRISRIDQQSAVQFTLKHKTSTTLGEISKEIDEEIADLELDESTEVVFSGDRELLDSTMDDMVLALVLAIIFVYIVMAAQFESLRYPFVIMFTMPLSVIGVAIALVLTKTPISLMALIGVIVLTGIVVNNAIVIVDYINQQKERGLNTYDALIVSVKDRARPILMTALTTILGLLPLSLGIGDGAELNQPLAITVIGGLVSSTFLTLFVIPVVYSFFDKETRRMNSIYVTPDGQTIQPYFKEGEEEAFNDQLAPENEQYNDLDNSEIKGMLRQILSLVEDEKEKQVSEKVNSNISQNDEEVKKTRTKSSEDEKDSSENPFSSRSIFSESETISSPDSSSWESIEEIFREINKAEADKEKPSSDETDSKKKENKDSGHSKLGSRKDRHK